MGGRAGSRGLRCLLAPRGAIGPSTRIERVQQRLALLWVVRVPDTPKFGVSLSIHSHLLASTAVLHLDDAALGLALSLDAAALSVLSSTALFHAGFLLLMGDH